MDRAAEHSHADLLKSAAPSVGVTFLALAVLAAVAGDELPVGPTYVPKALAAFGAAAALTLAYLPRHRPFDRFGPANAVTLCRAGFVALLAGLIGEGAAPSIATVAVVLGTFAAVLDGVDGRDTPARRDVPHADAIWPAYRQQLAAVGEPNVVPPRPTVVIAPEPGPLAQVL